MDIKQTLWANVRQLMTDYYGEENLRRTHLDSKAAGEAISIGSLQRIKAMETDVGLDVLNKIAKFFQVEPYQLLVQGMTEEPDTELTNPVNSVREPENKYVTEPLQEYDELRRQLLYFFDGMNEGHKDALVMTANGLYSMDNPDDRTAQPFVYPWAGQERRKGVLYGEVDLSGVRKNVHKDNGVPKQADNPNPGRLATHGKKKTA